MQYFNEMNSKYGFSDGDTIPSEAVECRTVYVKVLNKLLERFNSLSRILPFDRTGCHNWCLWIRVPLEYYNQKVVEGGSELDANDFDAEEPAMMSKGQ